MEWLCTPKDHPTAKQQNLDQTYIVKHCYIQSKPEKSQKDPHQEKKCDNKDKNKNELKPKTRQWRISTDNR